MNKSLVYRLVSILIIAMLGFPIQDAGAGSGAGADKVQGGSQPAEFSCLSVTEIPQAECEALVALYNSTNGAGWINNTNWLVTNTPSDWHRVTVSGGHVTHISLDENGLYGSIPSELGSLANLQDLYLYNNQLSGSIPVELGKLVNLQDLYLYNNQLSGSIPSELGTLANLQELYLSYNKMSGPIPSELSTLANIQSLLLSDNELSGSIPPELGNLSNLQYLLLGGNHLSGSIPPELGSLPNLLWLHLDNNLLSSSIPSKLGRLANLRELDLGGNQLSGSIPSELGNLVNLRGLYLDHNQLSGSIPAELGNLTILQNLYLNNNQLSGSIPSELGRLSILWQVYLNNNQLSGSIPPELGNLTNLQILRMQNNQFTGDVPDSLSNLIFLYRVGQAWDGTDGLDLDFNRLNVPIGYPAAGNALHTFLASKDANWHLRQGVYISVAPAAPATLVFTDTQGATITIQAPGGAVTTTTELVYRHVPTITQTGGFLFAGRAFELNAYRNGRLLPGFTFEQAITIVIEYREADIPGMDENTLVLKWWNAAASAWQDAACGPYDRHPAENWFSVPVCHLSRFAAFAERLPNLHWIYLPVTAR